MMEIRGDTLFFVSLALVPGAIGVALGAGVRPLRLALMVLTLAVVGAYSAFVAGYGIYAVQCLDCAVTSEDTRQTSLQLGAFLYGILVAEVLGALWLGTAIGWFLWRKQWGQRA
jgi:hypothetical protein